MASNGENGDAELVADRYRLGRKLGTGGMASVYEAEDTLLGRTVALKRLRRDAIDEHIDRFRREAQMGAKLNHANLVAVYDILISGEDVLIAMEHVEGQTLGELLESGPIENDTALGILADVAAGLDHAHQAGITHRDVKPANVLIRPDGTAKVVDLGIAAVAEETRLTSTEQVIGTLTYMAPERLAGDRAGGPRADIYSLAMMALEMFTGELPWRGLDASQRLARASQGPPDLDAAWPEGPGRARDAIKRGLDSDPRSRPPSAGALVAELRAGLTDGDGGEPVTAVAEPDTASMAVAAPGGGDGDGEGDAEIGPPEPAAEETSGDPSPATTGSPPDRRTYGSTPPAARRWLLPLLLAIAAIGAGALVLSSIDGGDDDGSAAGQSQAEPGADGGGDGEPQGGNQPDSGGGDDAEPAPDGPQDAAPGGFAVGGPEDDAEGAALNAEGKSLIDAGKPGEAVPVLRRAVKAFTADTTSIDYAFALFNLGDALILAGRPGEAVPVLEARLQIDNQRDVVEARLEDAREAAG